MGRSCPHLIDAMHSLTLSKDGQMSPGIILLLCLTPATGTRKEPACAGCHVACTPQGSPPVFKREENMEASSRPDEGRNVASTAGFGQGGEQAQRSVRVWGDGGRIPRQTPDVCTAPSKSYSTLRRSHHDPIQQIRAPRLMEVNMPRSHHKHGAGLLLLPVVPPPPHGPCPINQQLTNPVLRRCKESSCAWAPGAWTSARMSRRPWVSNTPCVVPTTC